MATSIIVSLVVSIIVCGIFFTLQYYFYKQVRGKKDRFAHLFSAGDEGYHVKTVATGDGESYMQIENVDEPDGDLGKLIGEINDYVRKSKGTTDFSVIQNKTERLVDMQYDDTTARMSFPIYLGLMGARASRDVTPLLI